MKTLVDLASELQKFFTARKWRFCFIGGLAVQHWGEPRLTRDVDLSLFTGFGDEKRFIDELLRHYEGRIDDAEAFAVLNRVLLLRSSEGIGIDIALAGLPFEEEVILRSKEIEMLPGRKIRICAPEDLIILKAFADRTTDWRDVESVIARQGVDALDWNIIEGNLRMLSDLKEEPAILERLLIMRKRGQGAA